MPVDFRCTQCEQLLRVPDDSVGRQAKCPHCGGIATIPTGSPQMVQQNLPETDSQSFSDSSSQRDQDRDRLKETNAWTGPSLTNSPAMPLADPPARSFTPQHATTDAPRSASDPTSQADLNPFESPVSNQLDRVSHLRLASRWQRLSGKIIDAVLQALLGIVGWVLVILLVSDAQFADVPVLSIVMSFFSSTTIAIINWFLISKYGQSIGKMMVGTRIVMEEDGSLPGFLNGVVLRSWIALALQAVPFFTLIDALWIFGDKVQCVHDLIAGTRVIQIETIYDDAAY